MVEQIAEVAAVQSAQSTEAPQPCTWSSRDVLGTSFDLPIDGYDRPWEGPVLRTPPRAANYVPRPDVIDDLVLWYIGEDRAIKLIGHTGTGKTEVVKQFAAALNLPLLMLLANPRTEASQLIGGLVPTREGVVFQEGVLTLAALHGVIVLIDEANLIDPGEAAGLNALMEGYPYTIPETGETIHPHPNFRVILTQNPKSFGYRGRQGSDLSSDDRCVALQVPYMDPKYEVPMIRELIKSTATEMGSQVSDDAAEVEAKRVVDFANSVRQSHMGESDGAGALPCTMSTRVLARWVRWRLMASQVIPAGQNPYHYALRRVLTNHQDRDVAKAIHDLLTAQMNERDGSSSAIAS